MKNLFAFFLVVSFATFAQNGQAQVSIRGGINYASMSANATEKTYKDYKNMSIVGYQLGLALPIKITQNVALQPELMWIQKGGKSQTVINDNNQLVSTLTTNYVEVPLSLKIGLGNNDGTGLGFYVLGGPYVGIALNSKYKNDLTVLGVTTSSTKTVDYSNNSNPEKRVDWGANLGVGVSFGNVYLDGRYNLGINNLLDNTASNSNTNAPYRRNRGLGLTLGVHF